MYISFTSFFPPSPSLSLPLPSSLPPSLSSSLPPSLPPPLPSLSRGCSMCRCLIDVDESINSLTSADELPNKDHENHELFKQEHDEQLLLWMQGWVAV